MQKVIIAVAPVAASDHSIQEDRLVEDIVACARAGATFLHLHPFDLSGGFDPSCRIFDRITDKILSKVDIIIEGSTGSPDVRPEDRFAVMKRPHTRACTFTPGNAFVPAKGGMITTSPEDMKFQRDLCNELGINADLQLFETSHIENALRLHREIPFAKPPVWNLVYTLEKEHPVLPERVLRDRAMLPENAVWGIIDCAAHDLRLQMETVLFGGSFVRVGFEDFTELGGGRFAKNNAELVQAAVSMIMQAGAAPADIAEARRMLGQEQ